MVSTPFSFYSYMSFLLHMHRSTPNKSWKKYSKKILLYLCIERCASLFVEIYAWYLRNFNQESRLYYVLFQQQYFSLSKQFACMHVETCFRSGFFFKQLKNEIKKNLIHCNNDDPPIAINVFGICVSLFDTKLYVIIR